MPNNTATDLLSLSLANFPEVVPVPDFSVVRDEYLSDLARADPRLADLSPADPGYAMAEACAYRELLLRTRFNDQLKDALLISAIGQAIDVHGAPRGIVRETDEQDDALKTRIYADILADSAGTVERYRYLAEKADAGIARAVAESDTPAVVRIGWVPAEAGDVGDEDLDKAVRDTFADPSRRMLADLVLVYAGDPQDYGIRVKLLVKPGAARATLEAQASKAITAWATAQGVPHRAILANSVVAVAGNSGEAIVGVEVTFLDDVGDPQVGVDELVAPAWTAHPNETPGNTDTTVISTPFHNFVNLELSSEVARWLQR